VVARSSGLRKTWVEGGCLDVEEAGPVDWLVEGAEGLGAGEIGVAIAGGLAIAAVVAGPLPVFGDPEYSGFGGTARWWWDHTFGEKKFPWPW